MYGEFIMTEIFIITLLISSKRQKYRVASLCNKYWRMLLQLTSAGFLCALFSAVCFAITQFSKHGFYLNGKQFTSTVKAFTFSCWLRLFQGLDNKQLY